MRTKKKYMNIQVHVAMMTEEQVRYKEKKRPPLLCSCMLPSRPRAISWLRDSCKSNGLKYKYTKPKNLNIFIFPKIRSWSETIALVTNLLY